VEILLSSVKNAGNGVERIRQQQLYQTDFQRKAATRLVINTRNNYRKQVEEAIAILKDTHVEDKDKIEAALQILERQGVLNQEQNHLIDGLDREVNRDEQQESWLIIGQQYQRTNNRIGGILRVLSFNRSLSDTRLLEAIEHFNGRCGRIRQPAKDISWLSAAQQAALYNEAGEFDKNLYRMLLFEHVYDAIRGATLVLNHSYKYRHLEEYLLDKAYFGQHREQLLKESGLSHLSHFGQVMEKLKTDLDGQYKATNERFLTGHNAYLSFNESGEAQIKTPPLEKPVFAREIDPYFSGAGYVAINELLAQVENATHYLSQLEHLGGKHTKKRPSPETFFAALVGIGCNIRIEKMAAISKGINPSTLRLVSELYLNPESLKAANDHLIAFKNKLALPEFHRKNPDQLHTASDGQKFLVGEDSLNADYSYKYPGYDKALSVNTAIDERFSIFHSTVISASEKEAPYLVDIHLNNPAVKSTIHSTDTGGYTEAIFGITNMLSVFYAPRIKGLSSQQLFGFGFRSDYKAKKYPLLPDSSINTKVIEQNWEDILRLMVTLKSGKTTAYQIFKRLSSYARQNPLLKAIKEYGKIIKSGFILKYYDELALRQAIEKQLSRIEMVNRFSKAVFFGNNQEFSVGLKEEQEKVVLARRLIQNAIIVWNYLYLSELIGQLSSQKEIEDLLTAVKEGTIVHWAHVNFHGEYDFTDLSKSQVPRFNLETILNLKLEQVA
jgi:TnpA family transposase